MHTEDQTSPGDELRFVILDALGLSLAIKRKEAMASRASSGIEDEWVGDAEFYQGYDDANRHEFTHSPNKPLASGATSEPPVKRKGSTVFPNITQPYCDAAAARVGDMLLSSYGRFFAVKPTTIPDMLPEDLPEAPQQQGMMAAPGMPGTPPQTQQAAQPMSSQSPSQGVAPGQPQPAAPRMIMLPDGTQMSLAEATEKFEQLKAEAARKAEKAQDRIDDWLSECKAPAEMRKAIDASAQLGTGVLKGPVPVKSRSRSTRMINGQPALVLTEEIKPATMSLDVWNVFPDWPACGDNIHNGSFIFERDQIGHKKLAELKGLPGYIDSQIDKCIAEGPTQSNDSDPRQIMQHAAKDLYHIWYFHGSIKAEELSAAGVECDGATAEYPVMLTMVNDRVIRASLNPLESGAFPYDFIPWKRRPNMPWGMGVARQMRTPQRIVVAATRNMMDNAGQGSGPQFVVRRGVEPQNGIWEIVPLKIWCESEDSDGQAGAPFLSVVIPMLQAELGAIIQMGMKMAEDVTGLPQLMQGNAAQAPDTVGVTQIVNANGNSVLRRIARLFDDNGTIPHIVRYYDWLMEYGDNDDEKGDFEIDALGSTVLVEMEIQSQELGNVVGMSLNPAFGMNPKKAFSEFLKSRRFNPEAFSYTEEEQAKIDAQPPQPPPQIAVAQIRAQADAAKTEKELAAEREIAQMENQTQQVRIKTDTDRDTALVNAQHEANMLEHQARMSELAAKERIEILKYSTQQKISLDDAKVQLADTSMKLSVQKDLAMASHTMDLHKQRNPAPQVANPAIEPAGRAKPGQAFQA